jgi:hypothetical protein
MQDGVPRRILFHVVAAVWEFVNFDYFIYKKKNESNFQYTSNDSETRGKTYQNMNL